MSVQKPLVKIAWRTVLGFALIFLAADSARKLAAFRATTAAGEQGRPAPAYDPASPTGYADGRRNQILQSADGYHWVMQTQQMIAAGGARVRHVDFDNAPAGREVHWSSPPRWWLALVAWFDHAITGRPWLVSVEKAALYAGPFLLGIILLALVPWTARKFGAWPASLLAAGLVTVVPLAAEFDVGSFDHHGLAAACALVMVLGLLAGWISTSESARAAWLVSAFAGACGLWVNAATLIPVLAGVGLGALLAQHLNRGQAGLEPRHWRTWGFAGGAASLLFHLLEYFPSHHGWRLEVNHPLHAVAWAAAGDLLARIGARQKSPMLAVSAFLVALPLLVGLIAPARTFVVSDPFLWALHVDYIAEFAPPFARFTRAGGLLVGINVLPLLAFTGLWLARRRLTAAHRSLLALAWAPATVVTLLALTQQRWLHVAAALWLGVLVAVAFIGTSGGFVWGRMHRAFAVLFLALVFLPYPVRAARDAFNAPGLSRENIRQFALRDLAFWLRRHTGSDPVTVLSAPTATTELVYHGGFRGIGTLYWENLAGLRAMVGILGANDADEALALVRARNVTHLVLLPWGSFAAESARLARGLRADQPAPAHTFARQLLTSDRGLPDWVRPLPYRLPRADAFKGQTALVLEIVPGQTRLDATVRRAQFLLAMGHRDDAEELVRQVLGENSNHVTAQVTLAQIQRAARDRSAHNATIERLRPLLRADPDLSAADRIAVAWELAAAGIADATHPQVARIWSDCTERELRRLSPESLAMLLRLTRDFKAEPPGALLMLAGNLAAADTAHSAH